MVPELAASVWALTPVPGTGPELPAWSGLAAVAVGGLAGSAYAARRGFDVAGVLGLAVAQGLGGLLLLGVLLQIGTPVVLVDSAYLVAAALTAAVGFFFAGLIARLAPVMLALDALALGLLTVIGTYSAQLVALDPASAVFLGTVTATGGLVLRDVLAGNAPSVLRPGVFVAVASFLGAVLFVALRSWGVDFFAAQLATLAAVFLLRVLAVWLGWETRPARDLTDRLWTFWGRRRA